MFAKQLFPVFGAMVFVAGVLAAEPAAAKDLRFAAALSGNTMSTMTGSKATGQAKISVNTDTQTVDVSLDVEGLKTEDLWTNLAKSPLGAIHLHIYGGHDHSAAADSALLFPLPMGPTYSATAKGFHVEVKDAPYAAAAKTVNSKATFDEFVESLQAGRIVMNIHTNRNNDGEISGDVSPVA